MSVTYLKKQEGRFVDQPRPTQVWNDELQCFVIFVQYDFRDRSGLLGMGPESCCDRNGAIAFFGRIDPGVRFIYTYQGEQAQRPDTIYTCINDVWMVVRANV